MIQLFEPKIRRQVPSVRRSEEQGTVKAHGCKFHVKVGESEHKPRGVEVSILNSDFPREERRGEAEQNGTARLAAVVVGRGRLWLY
jgi:hypothetical protein